MHQVIRGSTATTSVGRRNDDEVERTSIAHVNFEPPSDAERLTLMKKVDSIGSAERGGDSHVEKPVVANGDGKTTTELPVMKIKDLESFYREHWISFIVWPALNAAMLRMLWLVPCIRAHFDANDITMWGFTGSLHYTTTSLLLTFAFHGFVCAYSDFLQPGLKVQDRKAYNTKPAAMATRQTAVLLTELVYGALPLRPTSVSWFEFGQALVVFSVVWDLWFFGAHLFCHHYGWAYMLLHKTHHSCNEPNCFGAYFVEYASHIIMEQAVVVVCCISFVPRDAFLFYIYFGTFGTCVEHCGFDIGGLKIPLLPITLGQVTTALNPFGLLLGSMETEYHDWHHEKFIGNYALSFTYLDRLFGTFNPGRREKTAVVDK